MMSDLDLMKARQALRILDVLGAAVPDDLFISRREPGGAEWCVELDDGRQFKGETLQDCLAQLAQVLLVEWEADVEADARIPYEPCDPPSHADADVISPSELR